MGSKRPTRVLRRLASLANSDSLKFSIQVFILVKSHIKLIMAKYCEEQHRLLEMEQSSINCGNFLQEDSLVGTDSCSFPASPLPSFLEIIDNSAAKVETLPRVLPKSQ